MMTNTITIFQQCADHDLVNRLSGLKQCPDTGRLYPRNLWNQEELFSPKKPSDEEAEDKDKQVGLFKFWLLSCLLLYCVVYILPNPILTIYYI